ncbi:DUF3267 domain-containing protein [Halorubellus sp. JP-L1]|uniref:DUF3267 domain-containing protein n=1 Tax=Halorubellus sp. JP-L1 TaxID=2715753 RepID=UPI00140B3957|nr:DUF3267 domain-containing protein [Halorubellus sp. JP-L1]NHN40770.1 DUF3267 domain-containing protein [Halorubellus sp. JP-L1]
MTSLEGPRGTPVQSEHDPDATLLPETPPGYADPVEFRYPLVGLVALVAALTVFSLALFGWLLYVAQGPDALAAAVAIEETADSVTFTTDLGVLALALLFGVGAVTALHEFVHGLAYRLLGYEVSYGVLVGMGAFYAAAFHQFQRRDHNLLVGAAPLVVIDAILVAALFVPNPTVAFVAFVGLLFNTTGAAGDLYLVATLLRMPGDVLLYDSDARHSYVFYRGGGEDENRQTRRS